MSPPNGKRRPGEGGATGDTSVTGEVRVHDTSAGERHRADELVAEAIVTSAIQDVRNALARFDGGWTTRLDLIGELRAALARAEREALAKGWPFLFGSTGLS